MSLNILTGRDTAEESVDENYATVRKLMDMFENKFGSINCKQLTGCDLSTEEGLEAFRKGNLVEQCKDYTEETTRMALLLMEEYL